MSTIRRQLIPVVSIISSPTLSSDVRHKATDLLHNLHNAYSQDKAGAVDPEGSRLAEGETPDKKSKWNIFTRSAPTQSAVPFSTPAPSAHGVPAYPHTMPDGLPPTNEAEAMVEHVPISSGHILRVHAIHMDRRRRFEIRVNQHGKLELWDAGAGHIWSRTLEKEQDAAVKAELEEKEKADKKAKRSLRRKDKTVGQMTDGEATTATDEEMPMPAPPVNAGQVHQPHREASVTSVELDRTDGQMATVTESGGLRRLGTVKDRLTALVNPGTTSTTIETAAQRPPPPPPPAYQAAAGLPPPQH